MRLNIIYILFDGGKHMFLNFVRLITIFNNVRTCCEKLQALIIGFNEAFT